MRPGITRLVVVAAAWLTLGCDWVKTAHDIREPVASPAAPQPVPSARTSRTTREDRAAFLEWTRRTMLQAYDRVGLRDPRWNAEAGRFIEDSIPLFLGDPNAAPAEDLAGRGRQLLATGCTDPLVLYLAAFATSYSVSDSREATLLFQRAVEGMKTVPYPRAVARYVASGLYWDYDQTMEGWNLRSRLAPLELKWFVDSLGDGSYRRDEDTVLVVHLTNGSGTSFFERSRQGALAALESAAWVDEWVRRLFSGLKHHHDAWKARGQGTADEVTEQGWKDFQQHTALARRDLVKAWQLRPDRPEAAYCMITVADDMRDGGETARLWFDRAVAAQMDYRPAYSALLQRLLPRWGGSYEAMLDLGKECLATSRFDTDVPLVLLEAVEKIEHDQDDERMGAGGEPIFRDPATFALLARLLDGYLNEPSRIRERSRFHMLYAVVSDKAGRPTLALEHLKAAGHGANWVLNEKPEDFVGRVSARGGPARVEVEKGEALYAAGKDAEALVHFRRALQEDTSPEAGRFLEHRIAAISLAQELRGDRWVSFLPRSDDLAGWEVALGTWTRERDGSLLVTTGSKGFLLNCATRIGPNFEIRGEMEWVSSTNGTYQGGVVLGYPRFEGRDWLSFQLNTSTGNTAYFGRHFGMPERSSPRQEFHERNHFLVRSWKGRLSAAVNGRVVIEDYQPTRGFVSAGDALVGFGGYIFMNQFSVRYRNVELRRLTKPQGSLRFAR